MLSWDRLVTGFLVFIVALLGLQTNGCVPPLHKPAPIPIPIPAPTPPPLPPGPPAPAALISLPQNLKVRLGEMVEVVATTEGALVQWWVDPELPVFARPHMPKSIAVSGKTESTKSGRKYLVLAWTAIDGAPTPCASTWVQVGDALPDPNPPAPTPPGPPPPPAPADPFFSTLASAWKEETDPARVAQLQALRELIAEAGSTTINEPALKTYKDFHDVYVAAENKPASGVPAGCLPKVRAALTAEMNAKIGGKESAPLDDAARKNIAAQYQRVANLLAAIK